MTQATQRSVLFALLLAAPALVGATMREILTQLPVVKPVQAALGEYEGTLGDLLCLVESLENPTDSEAGARAAAILQRLPMIDVSYANSCLTRALTWANNLARERE